MPKKILLADDSITIQKVVELTFSDGDYEVIAVNNGAKAVAKLAEMRPDIILSDIIMPEKNGYEVCEFVKSHPEYRNIPVVLLTGTFEPFDPDRADKAGCDAVVTKPFESQSLIHKVEELIEQARSNAPTAPAAAMPDKPAAAAPPPPPPPPVAAQSPWMEKPLEQSSFSSSPSPSSPASPFSRDNDMFGAGSQSSSSEPFGAPPPAESFSGETRAFPKMSFDDNPKESTTQQVPAQPAAPAWDDQPPAFSGETRAFPRMNFDEMQRPSQNPPATSSTSSPAPDNDSPFGASPSAESFSGETRAFPKMSMDDMKKMVEPEPPKSSKSQEAAPSPWDDQPAFSGETKAFPKMSFDDLQGGGSAPSPSPWDEAPPAAAPAPAGWPAATSSDMSASRPRTEEKEEKKEPLGSSGDGVDLTDEQVDRIARRVVQMLSDQVVRNIAWEVIPDLAEMVVKERIRQLESEA